LWLLSAATAGFSAVMQTSSIRARLSEPACYAPQMVSLIETSGSEAEVWLQAFAPYAALATLKISIALTSEDPTKRATPQGIAVWVALSGGVYAAIIYRTLHPVGAEPELLSALADLVVPPVAAAEDVLTAAQRVSDTEGLKLLGLGNAAQEGDIGMRPTIGGVNLFVFYVIYQVAFQIYLRTKNPDGGPNVALINGMRTVNGKRDRKAKSVQAEPPESAKGIAGVLGGGKTKDDIQSNPVAEVGSLAATVIVLAALVFGAVNPGFVEEVARKSQGPCVEKIVRGKRITCPSSDGSSG